MFSTVLVLTFYFDFLTKLFLTELDEFVIFTLIVLTKNVELVTLAKRIEMGFVDY